MHIHHPRIIPQQPYRRDCWHWPTHHNDPELERLRALERIADQETEKQRIRAKLRRMGYPEGLIDPGPSPCPPFHALRPLPCPPTIPPIMQERRPVTLGDVLGKIG